MKSKLIIFIFLFSQLVQAEPKTLIQSDDVSTTDYAAFLKTESNFRSVIETLNLQRPTSALARDLSAAFETAERSFLSETVESAHENYKKVIAMAFLGDWSDSQRQLIFHSYLRAAQTAVLEKQRRSYLEDSINFDSKLQPSDQLFPPPLVAQWHIAKKSASFATVQLPKRFRQFDAAFVNGVKFDLKRFAIRVPRKTFRLTLLSNQFEPVTKVGTYNDLGEWEPKTIPLSSGTCKDPQIHSHWISSPVVLYADGCVSNAKATETATARAESTPALFGQKEFMAEPRPATSVFKKPLFWGIVGTVVAVAAYSASRQKDDSAPATHKTGF